MKCTNCGTEVALTSSFCPTCGNVIHHQTPQRPINYEAPPVAPTAVRTPPPEKRSRNIGLVIIIILLVIVVLALSTVVGFLIFQDDGKSDTGETKAVSVETIKNEKEKTKRESSTDKEEADEKEDEKSAKSDEKETEKPEEETKPSSSTSVVTFDRDSYIFPSNTTYLTRSYLDGLTKQEVDFIRNEIFARRGYIFSTEPYKSYFSEKSWYTPNPSFNESMFNSIELANRNFIVAYEQEKGWM